MLSPAYKALCAVLDYGSFRSAGHSLGITGAAVSKHIKQLEEQLGVVLFHRTTRRLIPTEAAQNLGQVLRNAQTDLGHVLETLDAQRQIPSGRLRINVPLAYGELFLRTPIARYAQLYPDVIVDVDFDDRRVHLIERGYDLVVRIGALEDSGLIAKRVGHCPLHLCASPALIDHYGPVSNSHDISHLPAIIYSNTQIGANWAFRDEGGQEKTVPLRPRMYANSAGMMATACASGVGIAILPEFACADDLATGRLVRLFDAYTTLPDQGIYVIYPQRRFLPLKTRVFIDLLSSLNL